MVAIDSRSSRSSRVPYAWLIPISPSPMAETVRPWVPSVRVVSMNLMRMKGALTTRRILRVAHVFHPLDGLAVERLLDGDVLHGIRRRGTVPMLLPGLEPDHVARADLLDRPVLALHQSEPERDDQRLAEW